MYVRAGLIIPSPKRRKYTGARPPTAEMLLLIDPVSFRLFSSRVSIFNPPRTDGLIFRQTRTTWIRVAGPLVPLSPSNSHRSVSKRPRPRPIDFSPIANASMNFRGNFRESAAILRGWSSVSTNSNSSNSKGPAVLASASWRRARSVGRL